MEIHYHSKVLLRKPVTHVSTLNARHVSSFGACRAVCPLRWLPILVRIHMHAFFTVFAGAWQCHKYSLLLLYILSRQRQRWRLRESSLSIMQNIPVDRVCGCDGGHLLGPHLVTAHWKKRENPFLYTKFCLQIMVPYSQFCNVLFFNYLIYHFKELSYYICFQFMIDKWTMTIMFGSIIIFKSQFLSTQCEVPQLQKNKTVP